MKTHGHPFIAEHGDSRREARHDERDAPYRLYEVQNGNHIETYQDTFPQLALIEPHAHAAFDLLVAAGAPPPATVAQFLYYNLVDFIAFPSAAEVIADPDVPMHADPFFIAKTNWFRLLICRLYKWPWFEQLTLAAILISCVNLALDEPRIPGCKDLPASDSDSCAALANYLRMADVIITWYFTAELATAILSKGLLVADVSMLRSGWALLDVVVVSVSIAGLLAPSGGSAVKSLRSLRAFRALRALRAVSRLPQLRLVIDALFMAVPRVKETVTVILLVMYIFAVIGLQNFAGGTYMCSDSSITDPTQCTDTFQVLGDGCKLAPSADQEALCRSSPIGHLSQTIERFIYKGPWNFDNIGNSMLAVFELVTGENWPQIMLSGTDAIPPCLIGELADPGSGVCIDCPTGMTCDGSQNENIFLFDNWPNVNPAAAIYFIMIEIILNQLLIELFTGVIIDTYLELRTNSSGLSLLTDEQKLWVENMKVMLNSKPVRLEQPPAPKSPALARVVTFLYNLVQGNVFNGIIMGMIVANLAVMACTHYGATDDWLNFFDGANIFFTVVFTAEAALKICGLGPKQYFASYWCRFDFVLVLGAIFSLAFNAGSFGTLMRIFRIGRLLRLVRYLPGLNRLLRTLILCLPSLGNVAGLMFLVMYVFAIIAMNLFSGQRYGSLGFVTIDANFDSFGIAYFTMFRCMTGENFNGIMHELMMPAPFCLPDPGPNDSWTADQANCPTPWLAALFWVVYFVITSFMVVNASIWPAADHALESRPAQVTPPRP